MDNSPDTFLTRKRAIIIITALATTVAFLVGIFLLSIFNSPSQPVALKSESGANNVNAVASPTATPPLQKTAFATPVQVPTASVTPNTKATPQPTKEIDLKIKGNRNSEKYHLVGCPNYNQIAERNIVWFKTEKEAEAAGYTKSGNCH